MTFRIFALLVMGAAFLERAAPTAAAQSVRNFVAMARETQGWWLLEAPSGTLWFQSGNESPVQRVRLVRSSGALKWDGAKGIAAVAGGWLVAGRRGRLESFSSSGEFIRDVDATEPVAGLVRAGSALWAVPEITPGPRRHLLVSADGVKFTRVLLQPHAEDVIGTGVAGVLDSAVFVAPDQYEGLAFVRLLGGPVAFRVKLDGTRRLLPLEYRRTGRRDSLRRFETADRDISDYSSPARDLLVTADGSLLVLRNYEDVRTPQGLELRVGTVVDRYGRDGRHEASAELGSKARFIAQSDGRRVVCVAGDGRILAAPLGPPRKGGIE